MHMSQVISQWAALALNGAALLLFLAGVGLAFWQTRRERKGAAREELQRLARAQSILQRLLRGTVGGLVTQAEETYGAGTGAIKKSAVLAELLRLLPEEHRAAFPPELLEDIIESGLAEAKRLWGV